MNTLFKKLSLSDTFTNTEVRLAKNQIVETSLWQRQYDISTRLDNVIENVVVSSYPFAYYNGYTIFISAIEFTPILNFAYGKNCQVMQ